jgi:hypothetical protein
LSFGTARLVAVRPIHVDAEDFGQQRTHILADSELIGRVRVGGVAGGNVKEPVGTKMQIAAVVPALQPTDDDLLALRLGPRRIGAADVEPGNARAVGQVLLAILADQRVANVTVAILGELRVEHEAINRFDAFRARMRLELLKILGEIEKQFGRGIGPIGDGKNAPGLLGDEETIQPGSADAQQRMLQLDLGKDIDGAICRRWFRRADDVRRRPRLARLSGE